MLYYCSFPQQRERAFVKKAHTPEGVCAFISVLFSDYGVFIAGAVVGAGARIAADEVFHFVAVEVAGADITFVFVVVFEIYAVLAAGTLIVFSHGAPLTPCGEPRRDLFSPPSSRG